MKTILIAGLLALAFKAGAQPTKNKPVPVPELRMECCWNWNGGYCACLPIPNPYCNESWHCAGTPVR
jgi:hypothetical protein